MRALPNAAERQLGEVGAPARPAGLRGRAVGLPAPLRGSRRPADPGLPRLGAARRSSTGNPTTRRSSRASRRSTWAGAYLLDPYHELHLTRVPAGVYRLTDVAPDAFHRSRYFLEYYQLTTILDELTFIAYPAHGPVAPRLPRPRRLLGPPLRGPRRGDLPAARPRSSRPWPSRTGRPAHRARPPHRRGSQLIGALRAVHGIHLSPRQAEVALLILRGHSTASIALRLDVSPRRSRCSASSSTALRHQLPGRALRPAGAPAETRSVAAPRSEATRGDARFPPLAACRGAGCPRERRATFTMSLPPPSAPIDEPNILPRKYRWTTGRAILRDGRA